MAGAVDKLRSPYEFLVATGGCWGESGRSRALFGSLKSAGPAAVVAAGRMISDNQCRMAAPRDEAAPDISAQWLSRLAGQYRSPRLLELVAADAASPGNPATIEHAEIAAAGAGAIIDVAGIPEEITMDWLRKA